MILPAIFAAFLLGLVLEATVLYWADRRAIQRERAYWDQLSAEALAGYGRVFDWERDLP